MSYVYDNKIDLEQLLANGRHAGIDVYLLIQVLRVPNLRVCMCVRVY